MYNEKQKDYLNVVNLYSENSHKNSIIDVEWAPQLGRSFHLIATSSIDKKLIIWKLKINETTCNNDDKFSVKYEEIFNFEPTYEVFKF